MDYGSALRNETGGRQQTAFLRSSSTATRLSHLSNRESDCISCSFAFKMINCSRQQKKLDIMQLFSHPIFQFLKHLEVALLLPYEFAAAREKDIISYISPQISTANSKTNRLLMITISCTLNV